MEQLDTPDGPFDAVMSQFGVEYGDWPTMIQRLPGLLHPNARLQFICHAKDSAIVTAGDAEILTRFCDRAIVLREGRIAADTSVEQALTMVRLHHKRQVRLEAPADDDDDANPVV